MRIKMMVAHLMIVEKIKFKLPKRSLFLGQTQLTTQTDNRL